MLRQLSRRGAKEAPGGSAASALLHAGSARPCPEPAVACLANSPRLPRASRVFCFLPNVLVGIPLQPHSLPRASSSALCLPSGAEGRSGPGVCLGYYGASRSLSTSAGAVLCFMVGHPGERGHRVVGGQACPAVTACLARGSLAESLQAFRRCDRAWSFVSPGRIP